MFEKLKKITPDGWCTITFLVVEMIFGFLIFLTPDPFNLFFLFLWIGYFLLIRFRSAWYKKKFYKLYKYLFRRKKQDKMVILQPGVEQIHTRLYIMTVNEKIDCHNYTK